jgi:tetratricopeptide (TPR) repeat protein
MNLKDRAEDGLLEAMYKLALDHYRAREWAEAEKWLQEVVELKSKYKDVTTLLAEVQKQIKLVDLYTQGRKAYDAGKWETARNHFQKILDLDPEYADTDALYDEANKQAELPGLYNQASEQLRHKDWAGAVYILTLITDLDPNYKNVSDLLILARQKKTLVEDYQSAFKQFEKAEGNDLETDWQEAEVLLQRVTAQEHKDEKIALKLEHARARMKFHELSRLGKEHFEREEWHEAIEYLEKAVYFGTPDTALANRLVEARDRLKHEKQEATRRRWWLLTGIISIALLISLVISSWLFPNGLVSINTVIAQLSGQRTTPTPPIMVPALARVEIFMNGSLINPDQPPLLFSSQSVQLEVYGVDTNQRTYTSNDLSCRWSVEPLDVEDIGINTDECKTLYIPSRVHPTQLLTLKIEGRSQPFAVSKTINMIFNIESVAPTGTPTLTGTPSPTLTKPPTVTPELTSPTVMPSVDAAASTPPTRSSPTDTPTPTLTSPPTSTTMPTATATLIPTPAPPPLNLAYVVTAGYDHTLLLANLANFAITNAELLVPLRAASPSWSPDGRQIAFLGEVGIEYALPNAPGGGGIWLYDLAVGETSLLAENDKASYLVWSPNGRLIAYESTKDDLDEIRIFLLDAATGQDRPGNIRGEQPAWSPDMPNNPDKSNRLMIKACRPGCGLWTVDLDDRTPLRVTFDGSDSFPDWRGDQVVFASQIGGNWDIYRLMVDPTGRPQGDPEQLTFDPNQDTTPVFSPDGRYILFRSDRGGDWAIWVLNVDDTSMPRQVIATGGSDAWKLEKFSVITGTR